MPTEPRPLQRILVALDASPSSLAALEAAARLAEALGAEIRGLFVEDTSVLLLPGHPLAWEVGRYSAVVRRLGQADLHRQLRAQAAQARRALEAAARRVGVEWTFDVVRGEVAGELVTAACEADLVTVGRGGWLPRPSQILGSTVEEMLQRGCSRVLIHQGGRQRSRSVVVLDDGSDAVPAALDTGSLVAIKLQGSLTVLVTGDGERAVALQEELDASHPGAHLRPLRSAGAGRVAQAALLEEAGLLVLPASSELAHRDHLSELLDRLDCPLLVVRGQG